VRFNERPSRFLACISTFSLFAILLDPIAVGFDFSKTVRPARGLTSTAFAPKLFSSASPQAASSMPQMQMPMVLPLFLQNQDFSSTLVLTNAAAQSTYADVVLTRTNGIEITRQRVEFTPHSQCILGIASLLLSAVSPVTTGSVTVMQSPDLEAPMVILGQLSITYREFDKVSYIDEEVAMPSTDGSQVLRAVADSVESSPLVSIANLSESGQHVTIQCLTENHKVFSKSVDLTKGETLLTEACAERTVHGAVIEDFSSNDSEGPHGPVGISLTTDGMPGSLAAFGLVRHKNHANQFYSNVTFTDPLMLHSSSTIFAGVPVGAAALLSPGNYTPELSLTNFSAKDQHVQVQYAQTSAGTPTTKELASFTLTAHTSRKMTFENLQSDPQLQNSFEVTSSGAAGDVLGKLVSRNDSANLHLELLGKDAQDMNNGGSNPWSIENGVESTLLFFNHDKNPQIFNVLIASPDGAQWNKDFNLAPMETRAISIRDIIQNAVKDDSGKTLPAKSVSGQISWWTVGAVSGPGTGRLLQSNAASGMARSFACGCPYILCGTRFFDNVTNLLLNDTGIPLKTLSPTICLYKTSCNGTVTSNSSSQALTYGWSSSNTSILQISGSSTNSSVNIYGANLGTANVKGTVSAHFLQPPQNCTFSGSGPTNVMSLTCPTVSRGSSVTCTIGNAASGSTFNSWTFTGGGNAVVGNGTASSWSGIVVTSGTVTVNVVTNGQTTKASTTLTVTNRNWHTAPASPAEVANGTFLTLPVPPQNTGDDSGLGEFKWHYLLSSLQYSTINDGGPNQSYTYWPSNQIFSTWNFQYEINPDLENTGSAFYVAQCGNYNASTNPSGFISGSTLLAQTNRHEWNSSTQSHYAFYANSLNSSSNNPGDFLEQQLAAPGANLSTFANNATSGINSRLGTVTSDSQVQPYTVNSSETNVFLGNINYAPYTSCQ
jgi:hypothetical protein